MKNNIPLWYGYKVVCKNCKHTIFVKYMHETSSDRCNNCGSLKFGLKDYRWGEFSKEKN